MRLVKHSGSFVANHQDYEPLDLLRAIYGDDASFAWVPDNTPLEIAPSGHIVDPRLIMPSGVVKLCVREDIDVITDEFMAEGFTYQGIQFKMDVEHQNSYMFSYLLNQSYPYTVKGVGDGYLTFQNRDEHTAFIGYGFMTCAGIIYTGWQMKDALNSLTKEQLLEWTDIRLQ